MRYIKKSIYSVFFLAWVFSTGCSPSIFTGDTKNDQKDASPVINKACFGLDLSEEALTAPSFKGLIRCLNANGSIQAYEALVNKLTDEQLDSLLVVINQELILNKKRLKEVDRSFDQMDKLGIVDRALKKIGKVLENEQFLTSSLKLLHKGASTQEKKVEPSLLTSTQILSQELDAAPGVRANLTNVLDMSLRMTSLESFKAMTQGLKMPLPNGVLNMLTSKALTYLQDKIKSNHALGKTLLWGVADGTLLQALDRYNYGSSEQELVLSLDHQMRAMEHFLQFLTVDHKDLLVRLSKLYKVMDDSIECLDGTKEIPNADMYVMDEFLRLNPLEVPFWALRSNMLKLKTASSMCRFPSIYEGESFSFNELVGVLRILAQGVSDNALDQRPLVTVTHFLKALNYGEGLEESVDAKKDLDRYRTYTKSNKPTQYKDPKKFTEFKYDSKERYRRFLIEWLGDRSEINLSTHLVDALSELSRNERGVTGNLLYFLNAAGPGSKDRDNLQSFARILMKVRAELRDPLSLTGSSPVEGRSLHDVLSQILLKIDSEQLHDVLSSLHTYIISDEEYVRPLLLVIKEALLMNDANPFIEIALAVGKNAPQHEKLFNTLLEIAPSTELANALKLTSKMAANGSLKEFIQGMLFIFKNSAQRHPADPQLANVPEAAPVDAERNKKVDSVFTWNPLPVYWAPNVNACSDMNLDWGLGNTGHGEWANQLNALAACVNTEGNYPDVPKFVEYSQTAPNVVTGKKLAPFLVDFISDLFNIKDSDRKKKAYDEYSDLLTNNDTFKDLVDFQKLLTFTIANTYCPLKDLKCFEANDELSVTQSLGRVLQVLVPKQKELQQLFNLGAKINEDERMPKSLALIYDTFHDVDGMPIPRETEHPNLDKHVIKKLKALIKKYEKPKDDAELEKLVAKKTNNYWNELQSGQPLTHYENSEVFKAALKPLVDKLSDYPGLLEATLKFMFKLDQNPYDPEWWASWFHRLSYKVRAIPYYYPGTYPFKDKPTIRLVNQLDMLELVVINADFTLNEAGEKAGFLLADPNENNAIKYLAKLAQKGDSIKEMQDWVDEMGRELDFFRSLALTAPSKWTDLFVVPEVERRLFNMITTYPVLQELLNQGNEIDTNGKTHIRNDLGVLRDLFKSIIQATPKCHWNTYNRDVHSLGLVTKLVQFGLLRNIGTNVWYKDEEGYTRVTQIHQILKTLAKVVYLKDKKNQYTLNPSTLEMLNHLLRKDQTNHPQIFNDRYVFLGKLLDQIFVWTNGDSEKQTQGQIRVLALMKQAGYKLTQLLEEQDKQAFLQGKDLYPMLAEVLRPALGTKKGTTLLGDNLDLLGDVLTSPKTVNFLDMVLETKNQTKPIGNRNYIGKEAFKDFIGVSNLAVEDLSKDKGDLTEVSIDLLDTLYKDPDKNITELSNLISKMSDDPSFVDFKNQTLDRVLDQVVHWLVNPDGRKVLPRRVQEHLAMHLRNGDVTNLLAFIGKESPRELPLIQNDYGKRYEYNDKFFNHIRFLGEPYYVQSLQDFLGFLRRGMEDIYFLDNKNSQKHLLH